MIGYSMNGYVMKDVLKRGVAKRTALSCLVAISFLSLSMIGLHAEYTPSNDFVKEVFAELNLLRAKPQEYATYLEDAMKRFDGKVCTNAEGVRIMTEEGAAPYKEVIDILKSMKAVGSLSLEKGLCVSAQEVTDGHVANGSLGFNLSDGTTLWENGKKYYIANGEGAIMRYSSTNARDAIIALLVDDGLHSRANRKYLLNPNFRYVGAGFSQGEKHPHKTSCLIIFASYYLDASLSYEKIEEAPYINNKDYVAGYDSKNELLKEIQKELNMVRCNPKDYAQRYIKPILERFSDDHVLDYDGQLRKSREGATCVQECIKDLESAKPCGALTMENILCDAATWLAEDIVKFKRRGHVASDGSSPVERVKRFGFVGSGVGENISYTEQTAREIVIVWLLDDGVMSRGHRKNILNPNYTKVGVGMHYGEDAFRSVCVMDFAY